MEIDLLNQVILVWLKAWAFFGAALWAITRSRNTSASTLHGILFFVLLGSALLPLLVARIPGVNILALPPWAEFKLHLHEQSGQSQIFPLLVGLYLVVTITFWARRFWQIRRVYHLGRLARDLSVKAHLDLLAGLSAQLHIRRPLSLRYSNHISTPITFGALHPKILLPRESLLWSNERTRRFMLHELAHVARYDWFIKQIGHAIAALFWAIPAVWKVQRKLEWLAELACDDVVVRAEGRRSDYAGDLIAISVEISHSLTGAVAATGTPGSFERIAAVLDGSRVRQRDSKKLWLYVSVFAAVLFLVAGLRLSPRAVLQGESYEVFPLTILSSDDPIKKPSEEQNYEEQKQRAKEYDAFLPEPHFHISRIDSLDMARLPVGIAAADTLTLRADIQATSVEKPSLRTPLVPLMKVVPEYPRRALRKEREGIVELSFTVLPSGDTADIRIIRAEPTGLFDRVAIDAVKQYRYVRQEQTIYGVTEIFEFRLIEDANQTHCCKK